MKEKHMKRNKEGKGPKKYSEKKYDNDSQNESKLTERLWTRSISKGKNKSIINSSKFVRSGTKDKQNTECHERHMPNG